MSSKKEMLNMSVVDPKALKLNNSKGEISVVNQ